MSSLSQVELFKGMIDKINHLACENSINIMEICGTHTRMIHKYGINNLIEGSINLISGPGCPICVAPSSYIDNAVELSSDSSNIIVTFGDLMRVPGKSGSLIEARQMGGNIQIVYSPLDVINIANLNKDKNIIFLAVGFETTVPSIALMIEKADELSIKNLFILDSLKNMPKVLEKILKEADGSIEGILCPGHVATITGISEYKKLATKYRIPMVVSGFEPVEIAGAILTIVEMKKNSVFDCVNRYKTAVRNNGNNRAIEIAEEVFDIDDGIWRGIGRIQGSGYKLKDKYKEFSAHNKFDLGVTDVKSNTGCMCDQVLMGKRKPAECKLFKVCCSPLNPIGPCMVSMEGSCRCEYDFLGDD